MTIVHTGIPGLDIALGGGIPSSSMVIVEGKPGTGKTTLGLQFICAGAQQYNEPGVYVTFEELPEQVYWNATRFGCDLRQLEHDGLVRVVGCAPDLFSEQLRGTEGYLQNIVNEIGAKRIVVDSINLLHMTDETNSERYFFYSILQALRRLSLTALLVWEESNNCRENPIEHYVADGIVHLGTRDHDDTFSRRTLRVAKMRGNSFLPREFVLRICSQGIYVAAPMGTYHTLRDDSLRECNNQLESVLSNTLTTGSITLFDVSSLVNVVPIKRAVMLHRIMMGDKQVVWSLSASTTIGNIVHSSPELMELFLSGKMKFVEHLRRPSEFGENPNIINASYLEENDYRELLVSQVLAPMKKIISNGGKLLLGYDVNDVHNLRGSEFVVHLYPEIVAYEKSLGLTTCIFANLNEISMNLRFMLERTSDNVVRIWVDSGYEYLQIVKARKEYSNQPFIVETEPNSMNLRLV